MISRIIEKIFDKFNGIVLIMAISMMLAFNIGQRIGRAEGRINEMLKFLLHMMQHMEIERQIFAPAREIEPPVFKDDAPQTH